MRILSGDDVAGALDYASLIDALDEAFRSDITVPVRHHHTVPVEDGRDSTLLLMPAWQDGTYIGVKIVCAVPENAGRGLPAVQATYQLFDHATGRPLALLDGPELTARRTACASAMASRYLSRPESQTLLVVGTGVLAPHLIGAHAAARPISQVLVWGRNPDKAADVKAKFAGAPFAIEAAGDLAAAVGRADIVSCATLATEPLVHGAWLRAGQHLDLVGAFTPTMREADDEAVRRARVYVDTEGAIKEAGEIVLPLQSGALAEEDIQGDLFDLTRGEVPGRGSDEEITLFKSAGTAIEDLAAARLAFERAG